MYIHKFILQCKLLLLLKDFKLIKKSHLFLTKLLATLNIIILLLIVFNILGCNISEDHIFKNLDIEQGVYLTVQDIQKIHLGATKSEVLSSIGDPVLKDLFGSNTWYYVYYRYYSNGQSQSQTIILSFDANDVLVLINNL